MSSGVNIEEVLDAVEDLIKRHVTGVAGLKVQALTSEDFSIEENTLGKILAKPPAVLLAFRDASLDPGSDHTATEYRARLNFLAFCGAQSLRAADEERAGALGLLAKVANVLAGARLKVTSATNRLQCVLERVQLVELGPDGTWYGLNFFVHGPSQFGGVAL